MFFNSIAAAAVGLVASANAHMLLAYPPPFPGNQNGPLGDGRNFPCQGKISGGTSTTMALGSTQKLTFQGGATHGGGSCQIALTNEKAPTAATKFRVITSIHGGCPLSSEGNNGNDASAALDSGLQFKIPDDIPAGDYVLSWTWFNRIGNREMYMNCAPVTLTGTGGAKSNLDSLPEIFVTHSPSSDTCLTPEGSDYIFPNPGNVVFEKGEKSRLVKLTCPASTPGGTPGTQTNPSTGNGEGAGSGNTQPASTQKSSTAGSQQTAAPKSPSNGIKAPVPDSGAGNSSSSAPPAATTTTASVAIPTPTKAASQPAATQVASDSGACTPGQFKCVDGKSFQQCTAGQVWAAVMQMAAGTSCDTGKVAATIFSITKRGVAFRA